MASSDERLGNRLAQVLVVFAILVGWAGLMIVMTNIDPVKTGPLFAGTPFDSPLWIGLVLLTLAFGITYLAKQVGVRYGSYPPERGFL
jgi:hypothetical protein